MKENKLETNKSVFDTLSKVKLTLQKKGRFNYASWAEAWSKVKSIYPEANYRVISYKTPEKGDKLVHPISKNGGGFVLVEVTLGNLTHQEYFPILNNFNKSIAYDMITAFDVNTSIKRGLVKCLALHGLGLYVFDGDEFPQEEGK